MTNNIADISTFENLQNQANASMGYQSVSGMAVFNDVTAVQKKAKVWKDMHDRLSALQAKKQTALLSLDKKRKELEASYRGDVHELETDYQDMVKQVETLGRDVRKAAEDVGVEGIKEAKRIQAGLQSKPDDPNLLKEKSEFNAVASPLLKGFGYNITV
jgi:hypothetical protein